MFPVETIPIGNLVNKYKLTSPKKQVIYSINLEIKNSNQETFWHIIYNQYNNIISMTSHHAFYIVMQTDQSRLIFVNYLLVKISIF